MKLIITLNLPDQFDYDDPPKKIKDTLDKWVESYLKKVPEPLTIELRGDLEILNVSDLAIRHGCEHVVEAGFDGVILTKPYLLTTEE